MTNILTLNLPISINDVNRGSVQNIKKTSENDQEIQQSDTTDQPSHHEEESQNTNRHKASGRQLK